MLVVLLLERRDVSLETRLNRRVNEGQASEIKITGLGNGVQDARVAKFVCQTRSYVKLTNPTVQENTIRIIPATGFYITTCGVVFLCLISSRFPPLFCLATSSPPA